MAFNRLCGKYAVIVFTAVMLILAQVVPGLAADGKAVFDKVCSPCHKTGKLGAPVFGNKEAWAGRIAQGKEALYQHVTEGLGMMPAKGGDAALSGDEVKAAVDYIVNESK
ncbi:c-type cytochrome [Candidatus Magnetominusculus xianensis]|uniref:Cytochrome C n=1 Tax=Candidatus Magnetominusculus xianensis TaxID=1748249 RepID=A0ABR5SDP6_9BACT|nr:c-type cytochrome [Candidatus Magnetominusculus xianensis]KWT78985.1 cytochrome C [Candidatus Magnetominusculus xianensis]MBF0405008.1 cytochrome c5 family protein [Nitrospirota bacterium]